MIDHGISPSNWERYKSKKGTGHVFYMTILSHTTESVVQGLLDYGKGGHSNFYIKY